MNLIDWSIFWSEAWEEFSRFPISFSYQRQSLPVDPLWPTVCWNEVEFQSLSQTCWIRICILLWFSYTLELEKHWCRLGQSPNSTLYYRGEETKQAVTAMSGTECVPNDPLQPFPLYPSPACTGSQPLKIGAWRSREDTGASASRSAGWKRVEQEREESKFLDSQTTVGLGATFPLI